MECIDFVCVCVWHNILGPGLGLSKWDTQGKKFCVNTEHALKWALNSSILNVQCFINLITWEKLLQAEIYVLFTHVSFYEWLL